MIISYLLICCVNKLLFVANIYIYHNYCHICCYQYYCFIITKINKSTTGYPITWKYFDFVQIFKIHCHRKCERETDIETFRETDRPSVLREAWMQSSRTIGVAGGWLSRMDLRSAIRSSTVSMFIRWVMSPRPSRAAGRRPNPTFAFRILEANDY